jgi:hypothetical protein
MLRKRLVIATTVGAMAAVGVVQVAHGGGSSAPAGLSSYGRLAWNLDALVHDYYGGGRACMRRQHFEIHRCASADFNDGDYRATFATARHSSFRAVARSSNPFEFVNAVPIMIDGHYIECG